MPELVEQMYCSQQIVIPPKFPYILKRYCKAAIKTQPYDLLRWSFEYFRALADRRPPPVKLRLEYPVYSTEGGLTRGCLKVLANQLAGQQSLPLTDVKAAWQGFCLDPEELNRIFCLCEVYMRHENIQFLHFIAVAGGMLTKSLTHTMILLCETLTKEPDGGSAAICVRDFLTMYRFLAAMDASTDTRYIDGYREGYQPVVEEESIEEEEVKHIIIDTESEDDYWHTSTTDLQKLAVINDHFANTVKLSSRMTLPVIDKIERSPSAERAAEMERENYMKDWTEKPRQDEEVNKTLRQISAGKVPEEAVKDDSNYVTLEKDKFKGPASKPAEAQKEEVQEEEKIEIYVFDEDGNAVPWEYYGEPELKEGEEEEEEVEGEHLAGESKKSVTTTKSATTDKSATAAKSVVEDKSMTEGVTDEGAEEIVPEVELTEKEKLQAYVQDCYQDQVERREDLEITFEEIAALVDRYQTANYDLGMVAGRQMSITSGEFIVQHIEKEILEYIDEQIGILPDPDLKKKKAKPEEVSMIREMLESWMDENMDIIAPEIEEVEEEEEPIPEITVVHAVPGIGPPVDDDTMHVFAEYAMDVCKVQAELFMPRNIRHFMCPPLEKYVENLFEDDNRKPGKEPIPLGGIITD